MRSRAPCLLLLCVATLLAADKPKADQPSDPNHQVRSLLQSIQQVVGGWRGTGQPVRNSNKGAWRETANWVWDLKHRPPGLKLTVEDGKLFKGGLLTADPKSGEFLFQADLTSGDKQEFRGKQEKERLVLLSKSEQTEQRLTLTLLNDKRTLILLEKRPVGGENYQRVAEIGYTREGTRLAVEGQSGRECIVTGGEGTIRVSYKRKSYWVCCSGCKAAFDEDPETILKEYEARVAARQKGQ
ncbi:MAG: hypothetical protein U0903_00550 [Planctomycetales bacterium]